MQNPNMFHLESFMSFLFLVEFKRKEHFKVYKIPGGKKISLGDEESMYAFDSYYPEWKTNFYMVPSFLSKRDNLFGEDKGYRGEAEIAKSFIESNISGILISNFSSKDENKILQMKSKETFEIDFIFLAENFEMWIIEVRKSKPSRIPKSIKEKFEQAINNRNHILRLATKMFGKQFSDALGKICNSVVAIPDANADDFKKFKSTEIWKNFKSESPCYKVEFISDKWSVIECISSGKQIFLDDLNLITLSPFYAALTLVKTSMLSFDPEQYLSRREKIGIAKFTDGMHPSEYHIILSPEQWSILEELPTHIQIVGEAATGKTELLKALLFKVLKYFSMKEELRDHESKISKISEGLEQILFIIFGDRPYLEDNIQKFISQVRKKLNLSKDHQPVVELHMIPELSPEDIDTRLSKLLKSKGITPKNSFILIDECYHQISNDSLSKVYDCRGCWMAGVLTGQNPLNTGWIPYTYVGRFQIRPLRRLYRGTKGITMASSTLRLASFSDFPSFLANQFSYIESCNDLKVKDIDKFPGLQDAKDTLAVFIKGDSYSGSSNLHSRCDSTIIEEIHLNDDGIAENCLYLSKCTGVERNSVIVIIKVSFQKFLEKADVLFKLLSIYTSRAITTCTIHCRREVQGMLQNKLFPQKNVQVLRSGKNVELQMFMDKEIISDLESINSNLNPLAVASGADNSNAELFEKLIQDQPPLVLLDTFENIMRNSVQPKMGIVQALLEPMNDINMRNEIDKTPLIIAAEHNQTETIRHLMHYSKDVKTENSNKDTAGKESTEIVLDLVKDRINVNARDNNGSSALIFAARNVNVDIVKCLIEANANVNGQDEDGDTALIRAAHNGHLEIVKYFIEADANVNGQGKDGLTALIRSARNGHMETVKYLIEADANVNKQDKNGFTALIRAAQNGHVEIVKCLIGANANVSKRTNNGSTALSRAAQYGHTEIVKYLVGVNANVNGQNKKGATALFLAASYGHTETVKCLIEADANVNRQDRHGNTALILAAENGHLETVKYLIGVKANVNGQNKKGATALFVAAFYGYTETVKYLIEADANVNRQDKNGNTALIRAAKNGHVETVKCLIEANANVNEQTNNGFTALSAAAQKGYTENVKYLIGVNANVNRQDKKGATALFDAAFNGHTEIVKYLIEADANVNRQDKNGNTALIHAAQKGHIEIVKYLIKANANVNGQDKNAVTALILAVENGQVEIVKYLIEANADVNAQDKNGGTALIFAAQDGHMQIVKYLTEVNASVNEQTNNGFTALSLAAQNGHTEIVKYLIGVNANVNGQDMKGATALFAAAFNGHTEIVKYLIEADANVNRQDKDGNTALILAAHNGHVEVLKYLVEANAKVNRQDEDGDTALILAAHNGYVEIVKYLIKANTNVNGQDKNGVTALILAAENGQVEIVKYLIEASANVNEQDEDGNTALILAAHNGHVEIVKYLIEANTNVNLQDKNGVTALIFAAQNGYVEIVKYLIETNANVNKETNNGNTARILALQNGHIEIVIYLIEADTNVNEQN